MSLKVAIQMDAIENLKLLTQATFWIGLEAQKRGHKLYYYVPEDMSLNGHRVTAHAKELKLNDKTAPYYQAGPSEIVDLGTFDVILMRQDPPFDMSYLTATYILEHLMNRVLVTNNPKEVRNAPEKLFTTHFPDLVPPTLITANADDIRAFRNEYGAIILKPLYKNAGKQIFLIDEHGLNFSALLEMFFENSKEPIIAQKYLPEVKNGDKRLLIFDGEYVGGITRYGVEGEVRNNLVFGGKYEKTEMTARDHEICERLGPELSKRGLILTGIDVIGDYLTEINVTSPTGLRAVKELYGRDVVTELWDIYERKVQELRS